MKWTADAGITAKAVQITKIMKTPDNFLPLFLIRYSTGKGLLVTVKLMFLPVAALRIASKACWGKTAAVSSCVRLTIEAILNYFV